MDQSPIVVIGAFIFNENGELFLRTTPSQGGRFTCLNERLKWGNTVEQTITEMVKGKTNLSVVKYKLIGLTDGLNVNVGEGQPLAHMLFCDYKVVVGESSDFVSDKPERKYLWLKPEKWLEKDENEFGQFIYEIVSKIK